MKGAKKIKYGPALTRKQLRDYTWKHERMTLPVALENKLLTDYSSGFCKMENGYWEEYSEQDIWEQVSMYIGQYAQLARQIRALKYKVDALINGEVRPWGSAPHPEV